MAIAFVNLSRVSRFTTPESIQAIGSWVATRPSDTLRQELECAFQKVDADHYYALLAVVDAALKFSKPVSEFIRSFLDVLLQQSSKRVIPELDLTASAAAEFLVLNWITLGLIPAKCLLWFPFGKPAGNSRCHICSIPQHDLKKHLDMHFICRLRHLRWSKAVEKEPFRFGIMQEIQLQKEMKRIKKTQRFARAISPERVLDVDRQKEVCIRCGDVLEKYWDDILDAWAWYDCLRDCGGLHHVDC